MPEQLVSAGFLRLVGGCTVELQGECGTCHSGRSIDFLVVSMNLRHGIRNSRADNSAPWSAHVAIAFGVLRKPSKIRTWQLVSPSPLTTQAPSHSQVELLKGLEWRRMPFPATCRKKRPSQACLGQRWATPLSYPSCFPSGRRLVSGTSSSNVNWRGSARHGRVVAMRGQLQIFRLKPTHLKKVDEVVSEGQGHMFWACVRGRPLEVERCRERGKCNCDQFRKSVGDLKMCAGELPTIPVSDQDLPPGFCTTISGLAGSAAKKLSVSK